jgi:hypothetical protein
MATAQIGPGCGPGNCRMKLSLVKCHKIAVLSRLPLSKTLWEELAANAVITSEWPTNVLFGVNRGFC